MRRPDLHNSVSCSTVRASKYSVVKLTRWISASPLNSGGSSFATMASSVTWGGSCETELNVPFSGFGCFVFMMVLLSGWMWWSSQSLHESQNRLTGDEQLPPLACLDGW